MINKLPEGIIPIIDTEIKSELLLKGTLRIFEEGQELIRSNTYIKSIPIVISGNIKVLKEDHDEKELLLYYLKPGDTCIMSFLSGLHHSASKIKAIAEERSELLLIPIESSNEWIKKFPEWTDYILMAYHKRFEELIDVVNSIAFQKIDERILQLLNKKMDLTKRNEIETTHQQLADELGTSREVISRLLKQLEKEDRLVLGRNKIIIKT